MLRGQPEGPALHPGHGLGVQGHLSGTEGRLRLQSGHEIWYRRLGSPGAAVPLLLLHGGPGGASYYLEPFEDLASGREVIFYDQLGCGRSDRPTDASLWRIERFADELDELRQQLGLDRVHLLGHSWGGWLAVEYLLRRPPGVVSAVLASTSASVAQFVEEVAALRAALPPESLAVMDRLEAQGAYDDPAYEEAAMPFYMQHLYRAGPPPEPLMRTIQELSTNAVYRHMNGPNEFTVLGTLRGWDRSDRLGELDLPVLVTVGRHDEITPACAETLAEGIPGAELAIFEESSHQAFWEEREDYLATVEAFLGRAEA